MGQHQLGEQCRQRCGDGPTCWEWVVVWEEHQNSGGKQQRQLGEKGRRAKPAESQAAPSVFTLPTHNESVNSKPCGIYRRLAFGAIADDIATCTCTCTCTCACAC